MNQRNGHIENKTKIEREKNLKSRRTCQLGGGVEGDQGNAAEEEIEGCEQQCECEDDPIQSNILGAIETEAAITNTNPKQL